MNVDEEVLTGAGGEVPTAQKAILFLIEDNRGLKADIEDYLERLGVTFRVEVIKNVLYVFIDNLIEQALLFREMSFGWLMRLQQHCPDYKYQI